MNDSSNSKDRVLELHELINLHSYNYHSLDRPTIGDHEYDVLFNELIALEDKYPKYKFCLLYTSDAADD